MTFTSLDWQHTSALNHLTTSFSAMPSLLVTDWKIWQGAGEMSSAFSMKRITDIGCQRFYIFWLFLFGFFFAMNNFRHTEELDYCNEAWFTFYIISRTLIIWSYPFPSSFFSSFWSISSKFIPKSVLQISIGEDFVIKTNTMLLHITKISDFWKLSKYKKISW